MHADSEKELLEAIKQNPARFGELFDKHYAAIFRYVFRRTGLYDLSRDVCAETFLKAYLKINTFQWKGIPISAWLFRIATNELNYAFRKQRYTASYFDSILNIDHLRWSDANEREQLEKEMEDHAHFQQVQQYLNTLDVKYQEVLSLRFFESKDINEISLIVGKPEGTVKSLLSRGITKLRKLMTPHMQPNQPS